MERDVQFGIKTIDSFDYSLVDKLTIAKNKRGYKKKCDYLDEVCAFDIETTNINEYRQAVMYIWMFQICGYTVIGRTWDEFVEFLDRLDTHIKKGRMIVFIHNASFEFQFLKSIIQIDNILALSDRKVIKFDSGKFEFRCSYIHSNMSLDKFLKAHNVPNKKLELDYSKYRFAWTPLSDDELAYCINDVKGLVQAIRHELKADNLTLYNLPLTSTGFVRSGAKNVLGGMQKVIKGMIPDLEVLHALQRAFRGGNTHGNAWYTNRLIDVVYEGTQCDMMDISSSYPSVLLTGKFPKKFYKGKPKETFKYIQRGKAVLMDVILRNVKLKNDLCPIPYLPIAKCQMVVNNDNDNGRIRRCDYASMTITEIDLMIIESQYDFDIEVVRCWYASKMKLPMKFREFIFSYYEDKTKLKGTDEYIYNKQKAKLNSIYGMMVTNPLRPDYILQDNEIMLDGFQSEEDKIQEYLKKGWLPYQWGVYCTCLARLKLQKGIDCIPPEDVLYVDTDSVKYLGNHDKEFEELNHELKDERWSAVDRFGTRHYIGIYEKENKKPICRWKHLGAKKYCYEDEDGLHLTLSGVAKSGADELKELENFEEGFIFHESSGNEVVYNDYIDDYLDIDGHRVHITSNAYITDSTYEIGMTSEYKKILNILSKKDLSELLHLKNNKGIIISDGDYSPPPFDDYE